MCREFPQHYILEKYVNYAYTSKIGLTIHGNAKEELYLNIYDNIYFIYLSKIMSKVAGVLIDVIINLI